MGIFVKMKKFYGNYNMFIVLSFIHVLYGPKSVGCRPPTRVLMSLYCNFPQSTGGMHPLACTGRVLLRTPKSLRSLECLTMEKTVTVSLNTQTIHKSNKSVEYWLGAMDYSEEEITKTAIATFNGTMFRRKKYIIPKTPPKYMSCKSYCLKHFDVPEELLTFPTKISKEIT